MISSAHKFIYLHVPKTGGNSIQDRLILVSDDAKVTDGNRDGVERFDLKGPITKRKHQRLSEYAAAMPDFSTYKVAISVRHPLERAISFYFSPHRWLQHLRDGVSPKWDASDFLQIIARLEPTTDFLKVGGQIRQPDFTIRFETLPNDFAAFASALSLPIASHLPHRNASAAHADVRRQALEDPVVRREISDRYAADLEHFGYRI